MRVVILGCGRVGAYLANMLAEEGHQVCVIDRKTASFKRLGEKFPGELVLGTGIDEEVLRRAGIEQADAFVAVTNGDNTNVMAAQVAREIFGVQHVICRIYDPIRTEVYRELGLETFCPTILGAKVIHDALASVQS
jgi:trk system potassium uptake protein TrkA